MFAIMMIRCAMVAVISVGSEWTWDDPPEASAEAIVQQPEQPPAKRVKPRPDVGAFGDEAQQHAIGAPRSAQAKVLADKIEQNVKLQRERAEREALKAQEQAVEAAVKANVERIRLQSVESRLAAYDSFYRMIQTPWEIGVLVAPVEETLRTQLGLPEENGVAVLRVFPNSPAEESGINANDIILSVDDKSITKRQDLIKISKMQKGKPLSLGILRGGKPRKLSVVLKDKETAESQTLSKEPAWIGVTVNEAGDVVRAQLNLAEGRGLIVTWVDPHGPAAKAGIKTHDIFLSMNKKPLASAETLIDVIKTSVGKPISVELMRGGKTMVVEVKPEPRLPGYSRMPVAPVEPQQLTIVQPGIRIRGENIRIASVPGQPGSAVSGENIRFAPLPVLPGSPGAIEKRLDTLSDQIKALQAAVDEIKDAVKKGK